MVTQGTAVKARQSRSTASNASPLGYRGRLRAALTPTVYILVITSKEQWPGWTHVPEVTLRLIERARTVSVAEVLPLRCDRHGALMSMF